MTGTPAPYVRLIEHLFRARLTGKSNASGEWRYAWTEQRLEAESGLWADAVPPRLGTLGTTPDGDRNYATELSGLELPASGELYWMLLKDGAGGELTYEVQGKVASSYSRGVGDGSSTQITVTHNLGTQDVVVVLIRNSDGHCVNVAWRVTSVNTIVLDFGLYAPSLDEYRVTVLASGGGWSTNVVLVYNAVSVSYVNGTVVNYVNVTVNYTSVAFTYHGGVTYDFAGDLNVTVRPGVTLYYFGGGDLNFGDLNLRFGPTVNFYFGGPRFYFTDDTDLFVLPGKRLTINGPGFLVISLPVKFYDGWWLHYRDVDFTGAAQVDDFALNLSANAHRVVVRVALDRDCLLTGMVAQPDGGAGQVVWLINDTPLFTLRVGHSHAASTAANRFYCPELRNLGLTFGSGAILWHDPDLLKWRVIGFCCGARTEGDKAAAGSTQGDAAPVVTDGVRVTGADGVKGVVLPSTVGELAVVYNDSALPLEVYPPAGETLEPLAADAPEPVPGFEAMIFGRVDGTRWAVINRDVFAKVSDSDTTHDYLVNKIVAGAGIVIDVLNGGGDEQLQVSAVPGVLRWTKYVKTFADFSVAATVRTLTLVGLGARTVLHATAIKQSVQFAGGGIVSYGISLGNTLGGGVAVYGSHTCAVPVSNTSREYAVVTGLDGLPTAAAWDVTVTADAGASNLDLATAGEVEIWLLTSQLP